jgi:hypothetical protein
MVQNFTLSNNNIFNGFWLGFFVYSKLTPGKLERKMELRERKREEREKRREERGERGERREERRREERGERVKQ